MQVQIEVNQSVVVITPQVSYIDSSNAHEFKASTQPVVAGASAVVIDMARVQMIDTRALQAMLQILFQVRSHQGELCVSGLRTQVNMMMDFLSVDTVVKKFDQADEAVAYFNFRLAA